MGMIFIYTYSLYPSYPFHTILTNKPYPPVFLLPAGFSIPYRFLFPPCRFLAVSPAFLPPCSRFRFCPAPAIRSPIVVPLRGSFVFPGLSVFRLVGRAVGAGRCSVLRLVGSGHGAAAPFLSARLLVPSSLSSVPSVVSWGGVVVLTVRSFWRSVRRSVVRFVVLGVSLVVSLMRLVGASRVSASRVGRLAVSSYLWRHRSVSSSVIAHRGEGVISVLS